MTILSAGRPTMLSCLIAFILLAASGNPAIANWVKVGYDTRRVVYAEPATIRRTGNLVRMWHIVDYKMSAHIPLPRGKAIKSVKLHVEYNCRQGEVRALYVAHYSEHMGRGAPAWFKANPGIWEPFPARAISQNVWKVPCGKTLPRDINAIRT